MILLFVDCLGFPANCIFNHHRPDLIQRLNGWAETTMDTEDLAVNDGGEGEVVKDLCAVPPHLGLNFK